MSAFKNYFTKITTMTGLAAVMTVGAGEAVAHHYDRHDNHRYDQRHDGRYDNRHPRDHRGHFNRHYDARPDYRPRYNPGPVYRPAPQPVCFNIQEYNPYRNRYELIVVCTPRAYR